MKPINLCTLEVRIGKCHLNLKSDGLFGVSLQMGKNTSQMSPKKKISNSIVPFNTTLRMNIDKELLQQQANPKCRILLYLVRQNRQKQVIGVATIDILAQNNQGFKYHEFGQCADCEADIEVSVSCSSSFQLGVKSQINYFYSSESRIYEDNGLEERGKDFQDSILDDNELNNLKQSKAVSSMDWTTVNRPKKLSAYYKPRRSSNLKDLRKPKPENLNQCAPQQIITHYETEIKTLQDQLRSRDQWANGMKQMIQELEAENQLLKQIRIEELQQNNIQNLQQGIDYVSKLVHSKFEASKSMIYDTQNEFSDTRLGITSRQRLEEQLRLELKQTINERMQESQRSIGEPKSYKDLPKIIISPRIASPLKGQFNNDGQIMESREDLENALKILTGGENAQIASLQSVKIIELQESLFRVRQQKQQLQGMTQQLYEQLSKTKHQRDSFYEQIQQLGKQLQKISQNLEQLKEQNQQLKQQNKKLQQSSNKQEFEDVINENNRIQEINVELQRKLKESVKAIEEFKNDALNARSQLIMKEDELNSYRLKFGELGSMTEVIINQYRQQNNRNNTNATSGQKKLQSKDLQNPNYLQSDSTIHSSANLHLIYTNLLETSINQRKELQHSLQKIISEAPIKLNSSPSKQKYALKKVQLQVNKLFIEIFKNTQLKNIKQIQTIKSQLSTQIDTIISSSS